MLTKNFVDYVKLYICAGNGGAGSIHFRRARFIPKGGPDGGNGGRGGHIIVEGSQHFSTLLHLKYQKHIAAPHGKNGRDKCATGANGKDIIIKVPLGTVIKDTENNKTIIEILNEGQQHIVIKGGQGGLGNAHFKSATKQTPRYAQPGKNGKEAWIIAELKLLADVGLVGMPNAGKSTLLSVVSAARPEIAAYPFTTLTPHLGIVAYRNQQSFIMADIPGIIEGAAKGKGLGIRFLRHIERNAILALLISLEDEHIIQTYHMLLDELKSYNPALLMKKRLLVISKADLIDDEYQQYISNILPKYIDYVFISSISGQGILTLKDKIWQMLNATD